MLEELVDEFLQVQDAGLAVDDGEVDDAEGGLKRRVLVEEVQDNLGRGASLQVDDDPHAVPVRLVADVGDALDPLIADVAGDILDKTRLVHLERDLADDDPRCPALFLDLHDSPDDALPAPGQVGVPDTLGAHHDPAGGEVRTGHNPHQFLGGYAGLVDDAAGRLADLPEVVGRHVRRHPDRNPARPVDEEVRDPGGEDVGLLERLVEVRDEVDGLLIDIGQEFLREFREPGLRVSHGGSGVPVDRPEVPLAVHQHVAVGEGLRHLHQRVVDGRIAVRMVLTHHVSDDTGALLVGLVARVAELPHGIEGAAVNRLQAVSRVRDGTADDHAHRVVDVA